MRIIMLFILAGIFIVSIAFRMEKQKGYTLIGSVTGFPDSTLLYLDDLTDGSFKHMDSTVIIKDKFVFKGVLKSKVVRTAVRTKDFANRYYIWLENTTTYFTAEKGKFKDAIVKGSMMQDEQNKLNAVLDSSKNRKEQEYWFVRDNPQSIIAASILSVYSSGWGKDTVTKLFKPFSAEIKNSFYGKAISAYITLNKNIKVGDKYADFAEVNTEGKKIKLSDYNKKVVLLEFWGSWCAPCRKGNPDLVKIYNEFNPKGFEIVGVAAETQKEIWLDAVKKDSLPWQNVTDLQGDKDKAALIYGVSYYPTNFLIDKSGTVIARDLTGEKLREKLRDIL